MALRTALAVLASLALIPAVAGASTRPKFPRTVTGTISGSHNASRGGEQTNRESWTIKDVRFTLEHVRFVENTWTAFYKVTGGTVTFSESQTGQCSYSLEKTFALKTAMPKRAISTPFFLERNMSGRDSYGGNIVPQIHWSTTETCSYPDGGEPTTQTLRVEPGNLFDSDSPGSFRIGKAMNGRYTYKDDYLNATTLFKWSLKPRR
jgi:hypothetical protein